MHTLMKVTMNDVLAANAAIKEGRLPKLFQKISEVIKPQSTFFYAENGFRTALYIFDLSDSKKIPTITEPLFQELNAKVEFFPCMDSNELSAGLDSWQMQSKGQDREGRGYVV